MPLCIQLHVQVVHEIAGVRLWRQKTADSKNVATLCFLSAMMRSLWK